MPTLWKAAFSIEPLHASKIIPHLLQIRAVCELLTAFTVSLFVFLLAGLAAAGGSSFWHDQLDRVRSLKQAGESVASLTANVRKP